MSAAYAFNLKCGGTASVPAHGAAPTPAPQVCKAQNVPRCPFRSTHPQHTACLLQARGPGVSGDRVPKPCRELQLGDKLGMLQILMPCTLKIPKRAGRMEISTEQRVQREFPKFIGHTVASPTLKTGPSTRVSARRKRLPHQPQSLTR